MKKIKTIAILGAGAMAASYAAKFLDASSFLTALVARDSRYDRLREQGMVVNGKQYFIPVVHPDESLNPYDLIVVALKNHHLEEAVPDLKNLVGEQTTIISVMNGLDSEAYLGSVYGADKVLYAISLGIDAVRDGNSVIYTNPGRILFGQADNSHPTESVRRVSEALETAQIAHEIPLDMIRMLWWKFMINVGVNQASAVMRAPYGVFQTSPDAQALTGDLMLEVIELAQHAGVNLKEQDLNEWGKILMTLSPQGKTSMLQDIEAGRKTEVEVFAGKVVDLGESYGIPTPVNRTLLRIIKVLEQIQV